MYTCWRSERRKFFQNFFFWISCSEWLNSQKKAKKIFFENFDFFSKSKECGGFWPFWPLEREPKFFWYGVFAKCYITSRRFYLQHFNKNVRAVFSQKPKTPIFDPFLTQKSGSKHFFEKSGSVTFFHLCTPNFMPKIRKIVRAIAQKSASRTDGQTN